MQHTARTCRPKLGTWLALFVVVALILSGTALPAAQAAPEAPLASPNQPTLVSPANGATGVAAPPTLSVNVTDPDSNPMSVSFYGRVKSAATPDFMLVLIPDPQNESQYAPAMFTSQTNWIVNNKAANNIVYVTAAGDMVNTSSSTTQYQNADTAIDILDAGGVRYTMATGNHDIAYGTTYYANYFGASRYASYLYSNGGWFGGSYDDYNTYSLFSASGMDFILINLQYNPGSAVLNWADGLLTTYSSRRAIVEQHDILNVNNSFVNQASYNALRDHNNLFLMLCGHMHNGSDGAAYLAGTGTGGAGQTIHIVQADYQDVSNGNGYLRLFRFSPANDLIYMTTYSPYINGTVYTTSPDQMNLAYDMPGAPAFQLIGTVAGVASGANASISWGGLSPSTAYEWYAVANDGTAGPNSATWSFTTAALAVPQAPVVSSITQGSGNVTLGWGAVSLDMNGNTTTITKYQVYGSQDPYFTSSGALLGEPTATTFPHTGGATGTTNWYYLVRAVDSVGPSTYSVRRTGRFGFTLVPGSGS